MNPTHVKRICVVLTGALGDFVLALPALLSLRSRFPDGSIHLAGNPSWIALAQDSLAVDRTVSLESLTLHEGFLPSFSPHHRLHRFLSGYDLIISWFGDREGHWKRNLCNAFPGRALVAPFHRHARFPGHVSDFYRHTLTACGVRCTGTAGGPAWPRSHRWPPTATFPDSPHDPGVPGLCIHPGSGSPAKNWPTDRFRAVAHAVLDTWQVPVRVLLGPAERDEQPFWESAAETGLTVCADLPLPEVSRLLSHSALYLGNDSGITHLAASLGVPTLALFGPTDPERWGPRGPRVRVLRDPRPPASHGYGKPLVPRRGGPPCIDTQEVLHGLEELRAAAAQTG